MVIFISAIIVMIIPVAYTVYRYLKTWRLYQKSIKSMHKKCQEIKYLEYATTEATINQKPLDISLTECLNQLKSMVGWDYHSIFRLDETKQVLIIRFTGGLPKWYMDSLSTDFLVKVGDLAIGRAVATKQPATINAAYTDPRFRNATPLANSTGYRSLSGYPLIGKLRIYGSFCTYSIYHNIFTVRDTQFFMTCANIFAAIIENKLLNNYIGKTKNN